MHLEKAHGEKKNRKNLYYYTYYNLLLFSYSAYPFLFILLSYFFFWTKGAYARSSFS